jgi:hypothetical protein
MPFFPRVDVAFVGLDRRIGQGGWIEPGRGMVLELVTQGQELYPVAAQLAGQPRRGGRLGDAAKDQHQGRGRPARLLQGGAGEGIEDPPAVAAAVVEDRGAMPAMDAESIAAASGASQSVGVEGHDQASVAGVLVHQPRQREVHHGGLHPGCHVTT